MIKPPLKATLDDSRVVGRLLSEKSMRGHSGSVSHSTNTKYKYIS